MSDLASPAVSAAVSRASRYAALADSNADWAASAASGVWSVSAWARVRAGYRAYALRYALAAASAAARANAVASDSGAYADFLAADSANSSAMGAMACVVSVSSLGLVYSCPVCRNAGCVGACSR